MPDTSTPYTLWNTAEMVLAEAALRKAEGSSEGPPSSEAASTPVMSESRQDKRDDGEHARLYGRGGL